MKPMFEDLAESLAKAWNTAGTIPLPAGRLTPRSRSDAFAIQERMIEIIGDRCVGWKVGAAVPAARTMEGYDGPIVGCLLAERLYENQAQLSAERFPGCTIESEIAFRFRRTLPARARPYTRAELEPELVLHPGLEITGHRYARDADGRKLTTYELIADNGACGAYVVGGGVEEWQRIDPAKLLIDARVDGGEPIQQFSGERYRDPVDILVETVNGLSERGIGLAAGDFLTTGSLTLPVLLYAGQTYVACFGDFATLSVSLR